MKGGKYAVSPHTSAPSLLLPLHEFFLRGKVTELNLGHDVLLADCADHFLLLLIDFLGLNVDPRDFPTTR